MHKTKHGTSTTVLLAWSTNPTTNSKIQHKKKHKLEHKKEHKSSTTVLQSEAQTQPQTPKTSTRKAQLFRDLEHKENHKLREKVQFTSTQEFLSKMIKRYQAWGEALGDQKALTGLGSARTLACSRGCSGCTQSLSLSSYLPPYLHVPPSTQAPLATPGCTC